MNKQFIINFFRTLPVNPALPRLLKDLAIAIIGAIIGSQLGLGNETVSGAYIGATLASGWRWSGVIITATSLKGILLRAFISLFLGMFALVILPIWDVVQIILAYTKEPLANRLRSSGV